MSRYFLEACVDSVESALAAQRGGANRLELCSALVIGGLSPSMELFRRVRARTDILINVMIRPRFGDFCYTQEEYEIMVDEVRAFREAGADGLVFGCLRPDGALDLEQMAGLLDAAGDRSVTLHRAFDVCAAPFEALEQAKSLEVHTILTSGQESSCVKGASLLRELKKRAGAEITLMAGAGISAQVIPQLVQTTGLTHYHMSGKVTLDSAMTFRREGVPMGLPGLSEFEIWRTSEEKIRQAVQALENAFGESGGGESQL